MSKTRQVLDAVVQGTTTRITFDFTSALAVGETITGASVTVSVYSGTDPNAFSMISGLSSISGTLVTQLIATSPSVLGGLVGVTYFLVCQITTSLSQALQIGAFLTIVPAVP